MSQQDVEVLAQDNVVAAESNQSQQQNKWHNKEVIAYLAQLFPLCFIAEGEAKPLKVGIFEDLVAALAEDENVSKTQLRHALRQYTSNWRYLHGCREGAVRVDLQGNAVGVLEPEHVEHAKQQLAEAKAKIAASRPPRREKKPKVARTHRVNKGKNEATSGKQTTIKDKNRPKLTALSAQQLHIGARVKVKLSERVQVGQVLELTKENARVQLNNGLVMTVALTHLFV